MKRQAFFGILALSMIGFAGLACNYFKSSPTDVFKKFAEASQKKDWNEMKKYLSKDSVNKMEDMAKAFNKSMADLTKEDKTEAWKTVPETRNEKIDGDKASLEVKDPKTDKWEELPFVKEEGDWKIDLLNAPAIKNAQ